MNPIDDQLNRLFRAARAGNAAVTEAPFGLETRVMAAWREERRDGMGFWDMSLLVRGLLVAVGLMGVSFLPMLSSTTDPFSDYVQVANSTIPADVSP